MKETKAWNDQGVSEQMIQEALEEKAPDGDLSCAGAFEVSEALNISPALVGDHADRMGLHLVKCQLGLFGYPPQKKIVAPLDAVDDILASAIREGLVNGRLPCEGAWEIADRLKLSRMTVSAACETLEIKIKPCQIGAF